MIRVVLADDQRLFVESLNTVLETRADDISVVGIAGDGNEAVQMVTREEPDVVLMDVRMPGMDGVEATRIIVQSRPQTRVMMLTTFDDDDYVLDALNHGAIGYVLKDIPPQELINSIRAVHGGAMLISPSVARKVLLYAQPAGRGIHPPASALTENESDNAGAVSASGGRLTFEHHPVLKFLTAREVEVLSLIGKGYDNAQIAASLGISLQTVKNHVSIIYSKLNIHDRAKVVRFAGTVERFLSDAK